MRRVLLGLFVAMLNISGSAQGSWGIQAAGVTTQVSGDGYKGFKKFGFEVGASYFKPIGSRGRAWGLEVNYIQKGALERQKISEGNYFTYKYAADYLDVPLSYYFPLWGVYLQTGVALSYNLRTEISTNGIVSAPLVNQRFLELGWVGGILFEINDRLNFSVRYYNSLVPVQNAPTGIAAYYWFSQGEMHSAIAMRLQYYFTLPAFKWVKPQKDQQMPISPE